MKYSIFTSNHPEAGLRIQSEAAIKSWKLYYDGNIGGGFEAIKRIVEDLAMKHRHVQCFRGKEMGKVYYGIYQSERWKEKYKVE